MRNLFDSFKDLEYFSIFFYVLCQFTFFLCKKLKFYKRTCEKKIFFRIKFSPCVYFIRHTIENFRSVSFTVSEL